MKMVMESQKYWANLQTISLSANSSVLSYGLPDSHFILGYNTRLLCFYSVYKCYTPYLINFPCEIVAICSSTENRLVLCFI